jgi:hypothetical protein
MNPDGTKEPDSSMVFATIPRKKLPPLPPEQQTEIAKLPSVDPARQRLLKKPRHTFTHSPVEVTTTSEHSLPPREFPSYQPLRDSSPVARHPRQRHKLERVRMISEFPMIMKIRTHGLSLVEGIPRQRSSQRMPKRQRPTYEETGDADLMLTDSDDEVDAAPLKRARLVQYEQTTTADPAGAAVPLVHPIALMVDTPPPGELNTLWYSREAFLHMFVLEKVTSWKTRTTFSLVDAQDQVVDLNVQEAMAIQTRLLSNTNFWKDTHKRMEVSRILPQKCPIILAVAADQAAELAKQDGTAPKYSLKAGPREEVLLVKWRGRSYLHCSWEREADILRLDPSNNTARNKIRRFYMNHDALLGFDWKKIMEEDRATASTIHSHGAEEEVPVNDDFFSPQNLEVERVLGCDENEMNMEVLAKQRAYNIQAERDDLLLKERSKNDEEVTDHQSASLDKATRGLLRMTKGLVDIATMETPWDPEDNVRYVVKWKGLPYAEMTWEYWRDIKRDAVDETEDFWHRQIAPDVDQAITCTNRAHPHIRDFRKLNETREYGIMRRKRPVADMGDGSAQEDLDEENDAAPGFKLRSYQLEGVNWLLFNWWNKRSCILADEMVSFETKTN